MKNWKVTGWITMRVRVNEEAIAKDEDEARAIVQRRVGNGVGIDCFFQDFDLVAKESS